MRVAGRGVGGGLGWMGSGDRRGRWEGDFCVGVVGMRGGEMEFIFFCTVFCVLFVYIVVHIPDRLLLGFYRSFVGISPIVWGV